MQQTDVTTTFAFKQVNMSKLFDLFDTDFKHFSQIPCLFTDWKTWNSLSCFSRFSSVTGNLELAVFKFQRISLSTSKLKLVSIIDFIVCQPENQYLA